MAKRARRGNDTIKGRLRQQDAEKRAIDARIAARMQGNRSPATPETCDDREMQDTGGEPVTGGLTEDFGLAVSAQPSETVASLLERYIPKIPPEAVKELEAALQAAQLTPPQNKDWFVAAVNRLLDVFELRISARDGELYRLRVLPGATGRGHIQLRDQSKGRGFKNAAISVVSQHEGAFTPANYSKHEK